MTKESILWRKEGADVPTFTKLVCWVGNSLKCCLGLDPSSAYTSSWPVDQLATTCQSDQLNMILTKCSSELSVVSSQQNECNKSKGSSLSLNSTEAA